MQAAAQATGSPALLAAGVSLLALIGASLGAALLWLVCLRRRAQADDRLSHAVLAHSPQLLALLDDDGGVLRISARAEDWLGQPVHMLVGTPLWLHPAWQWDAGHGPTWREAMTRARATQSATLEGTLTKPGGTPRHVEIGLRRIGTGEWLLEARDVTLRRQVEDKLRLAATVLDNAREGVLIAGADWRVLSANNAWQQISGVDGQELHGATLRQLSRCLRDAPLRRRLLHQLRTEGRWEGELDAVRSDGTPYTVRATLTLSRSRQHGAPQHVLVLANDITEWKRAQGQIRRHAQFDSLTALPNREGFLERLQWTLAGPAPQPLAVLRLHVDQFHTLSQHFNYETGDQTLMEVGRRLRRTLRETDMVARLEGESFAVLLPHSTADSAALVATKLAEAMADPCRVMGHEYALTLSMGVALAPHDGGDADALMRAANAALQGARADGQALCRFYDPNSEQRSLRHLQLESALRKAIARRELLLHFQPQLQALSGEVVGLEALVRWRHPELGMISPGEFIPLAERTGQIVAIGDWVMREAARQMAAWIHEGLAPLVVAVNLSVLQFRDPKLLSKVSAVLADTGLPPACLELELTEGVATQSPAAAIEVMDALHRLGVRLAIDDFGTGYSSLSYLKRFRIHTLKIDQSFVRDISADADDRAIVRAIIDMARALNLTTVAEGVETDEQAEFLRQGGCTMVQGYLYCRPQDAATTRAWLTQRATEPDTAAAC